jgi:hypothetical protein
VSDHNGEPPIPEFSKTELYAVMDALQFQEINHHGGPQSVEVHRIRQAIEPLLDDLVFDLHDSRAIQPGQQWTIPVGLSCGFQGEVIVRIRAWGPDHDQEEVPDA